MNTTIIAQSTAPILSAIAVIRISGENAFSLVKNAFTGFRKDVEPNKMYYGVLDTGAIKDQCLCVYFKAPHSYTGEDMVEIDCHGSTAITKAIIEYFLANGAVMADRGEFTRRAFLNGKLDLTQCEAVIDLINSQSEAESRSAYSQLTGTLKSEIEEIQKSIVTTIAKIEVSLDYPEEENDVVATNDAIKEINEIKNRLTALKNTYNSGKLAREGVKIAIVGKPNVGKSKILNSLLGYERAIVTDIAGTTRDTVSESYNYKGVRFVITDTAGIRETDDTVEEIGVMRAKKEAKECDILLSVAEAGGEFEEVQTNGKTVFVENKVDVRMPIYEKSVKISAKTGEGIENLKEVIFSAVGNISSGGAINNLRHLSCVESALQFCETALEGTKSVTLDCVSGDLNNAYRALGKITGVTSSDEIVGEIFTKFCVGK